jgi:ATP-binding cassette subfamily F protein uup
MLAGELRPDAGTLKLADGLRVAVFDQHRSALDPDLTLKRALCGNGEHVLYKGGNIHVQAWARRFLFRQEQLEMPLRLLSGGERARVLIAGFMLRPADLLLLDEPTNDLDLQSLEVLESSMAEFPGALVLVTHDRYLLERVSRRLLALDGRGGSGYFADLSQWENWMAERGQETAAPAPAPEAAAGPSAKETRELKAAIRKLESEMQTAERQADKARSALEDPAVAADAGELARRQARLEECLARVEALFERWSALQGGGAAF